MQFKGQYMKLASPPTIINKEEEYEVEEVQKHRKQDKRIQYLVHWKGYGYVHDQWIARQLKTIEQEFQVEIYKEGG